MFKSKVYFNHMLLSTFTLKHTYTSTGLKETKENSHWFEIHPYVLICPSLLCLVLKHCHLGIINSNTRNKTIMEWNDLGSMWKIRVFASSKRISALHFGLIIHIWKCEISVARSLKIFKRFRKSNFFDSLNF